MLQGQRFRRPDQCACVASLAPRRPSVATRPLLCAGYARSCRFAKEFRPDQILRDDERLGSSCYNRKVSCTANRKVCLLVGLRSSICVRHQVSCTRIMNHGRCSPYVSDHLRPDRRIHLLRYRQRQSATKETAHSPSGAESVSLLWPARSFVSYQPKLRLEDISLNDGFFADRSFFGPHCRFADTLCHPIKSRTVRPWMSTSPTWGSEKFCLSADDALSRDVTTANVRYARRAITARWCEGMPNGQHTILCVMAGKSGAGLPDLAPQRLVARLAASSAAAS
jgi:hypothetical protein